MFKIAKNKDSSLCQAYRCGNKHTPKDRFCAKHRHRYNKEMNPINYVFHLRKSRAKERGHEWDLTLEEFREFCKQTGYMEGKGKKAGSMSIDRIDNTKGYSLDNIQILSLSENSAKQHTDNCPF